jgi:hypothetical protein
VPQYWAEGRARDRKKGRQVTVRRWGWSDESAEQAQAHADTRTKDALQRILDGENLLRREARIAYNGADGVPIREEILSRHGDTIVTRNGYGALCLNTPDVLFADIDFGTPSLPLGVFFLVPPGIAAVAAFLAPGHRFMVGVAALMGSLVLLALGWKLFQRLKVGLAGGPEAQARRRILKALETRPDWKIRVYRTPAGFRVLVLHRRFDPTTSAVAEFFQALGSDPLYVRMCTKQHCFRARVSPKPWRIGIGDHVRPRPGVWPVHPARRKIREQWVSAYDAAARGYASCRYLESFGQGSEDPGAGEVRVLHDDLSRALTSLPIA